MKTIAVLFGERSHEHDISILTALQMLEAIDTRVYDPLPIYITRKGEWFTGEPLFDKRFYARNTTEGLQKVMCLPDPTCGGIVTWPERQPIPIDCAFLCFHGAFGEDGRVQALLELAQIPFVGSSSLASALAMHKPHTKAILQAHGIPTLPTAIITAEEPKQKIVPPFPYPLFVKPMHLGSSLGISAANNDLDYAAALAKVFRLDTHALVEPCIENLMEINVSVIDGAPPLASVIEIPVASSGALSFEDKYVRKGGKGTSLSGMAGLTRIIDPQELDPTLKEQVITYSLQAFHLLELSGVARFDFMVNLTTNHLTFNEVNPIPGSLSYYLWNQSGLLYPDLIAHLIAHAKRPPQRALTRTSLL